MAQNEALERYENIKAKWRRCWKIKVRQDGGQTPNCNEDIFKVGRMISVSYKNRFVPLVALVEIDNRLHPVQHIQFHVECKTKTNGMVLTMTIERDWTQSR